MTMGTKLSEPSNHPAPPTGQLGALAWFLRFFTNLDANRAMIMLLLAGITWFGWIGREDATLQRTEYIEGNRELKRDIAARDEMHRVDMQAIRKEHRDHVTETIKICNTAAAEQSKLRSQEAAKHRDKAMSSLDALKASVDGLRAEVAKLNSSLKPATTIP